MMLGDFVTKVGCKRIEHKFDKFGRLISWQRTVCGEFDRSSVTAKINYKHGKNGTWIRKSKITYGNPDNYTLPYTTTETTVIKNDFVNKVKVSNKYYSMDDARKVLYQVSGKLFFLKGLGEIGIKSMKLINKNSMLSKLSNTLKEFKSITSKSA